MRITLKQFIIGVVVGYITLAFISEQLANFALSCFLVLMVPALIFRQIFLNSLYKNSIKIVSRQYVFGANAIHNEHCTIMYNPDEKIVVFDNAANRVHAKRMFILTKDNLNINRAWNRCCRVFDSFITFDSLASFFSYETKIDIKTLEARISDIPQPKEEKEIIIDNSNNGPKFVEMTAIQPDPFGKDFGQKNDEGKEFVNIENLSEKKAEKKKNKVQNEPEFFNMEDIAASFNKKIDVNTTDSAGLAKLPGINIIMAKKIIEFRNTNGYFKTEDEFISAANVKEHFIPKIKSMITVDIPTRKNNDNDDYNEGRIVDL